VGEAARAVETGVTQLTHLLARMQAGDEAARDELFSACYRDLKQMAHARLRDGARNTVLDTTALVHDSYLRLVGVGQLRIEDRHAFFGYAARVMRSVIVDSARARLAERRGGRECKLTLSTEIADSVSRDEEGILEVHEALDELANTDGRLARVVEMRYFGGYSEAEIAEAMGLGERTIQRDWEKARMMLQAILKSR
jgi:RNA polymerase sigma factor (TIGR02999 family)